MNFFSFAILFFAAVTSTQAAKAPVRPRLSNGLVAGLQSSVAAAGGCNANVCFAIDGSDSLTPAEFLAEKNFVLDVVSVIGVDDDLEVAACQYGNSVRPIQRLTPDTRKFNRKVARAPFLSHPNNFMAGGLRYCFKELARRPNEANKIVVLGDGSSNIGSSAIRSADFFRSATGVDICVVGAGFTNDAELLAIAGGDPNKVFNVDNFLDVLELQAIIDELVAGICDLPTEQILTVDPITLLQAA